LEYEHCPNGNVKLSETQKIIDKTWNDRYLIIAELENDSSAVSLIPLTPPFLFFSYSYEILNANWIQFYQKWQENKLQKNSFLDELSQLKELSDRLRFTFCQLGNFWQIPGDSLLAYNKIKFHTCNEVTCASEKSQICQMISCADTADLEILKTRFFDQVIKPRYFSVKSKKRFSCEVLGEKKIIRIRVGTTDELTKQLLLKINRQYYQTEKFQVLFEAVLPQNAEVNIVWKSEVVSHVDFNTLNEVTLSDTLRSAPISKSAATMAHELGHILGLADCYVEYFSNKEKQMNYFELDPSNLMCRANAENRLSKENFEAIFKHHCQAD
jgi:hypothetical protein